MSHDMHNVPNSGPEGAGGALIDLRALVILVLGAYGGALAYAPGGWAAAIGAAVAIVGLLHLGVPRR